MVGRAQAGRVHSGRAQELRLTEAEADPWEHLLAAQAGACRPGRDPKLPTICSRCTTGGCPQGGAIGGSKRSFSAVARASGWKRGALTRGHGDVDGRLALAAAGPAALLIVGGPVPASRLVVVGAGCPLQQVGAGAGSTASTAALPAWLLIPTPRSCACNSLRSLRGGIEGGKESPRSSRQNRQAHARKPPCESPNSSVSALVDGVVLGICSAADWADNAPARR